MNDYFILFETNPLIEGFTKDIIIDIQRSRIINIPKTLFYVIKKLNKIGKEKTFELKLDEITLNKYMSFLLENELGVFCSKEEKKFFPKLDKNNISPSYLNVIYSKIISTELDNLFNFIEIAKTYNGLFILEYTSIKELDFFILKIKKSRLKGIDIIINNSPSEIFIQYLINHCPKLITLYIYNQTENQIKIFDNKTIYSIKHSFENYISNQSSNPSVLLNNNFQTYLEAKNNNIYFNKKVYINEFGIIYPSLLINKEIGNVNLIKTNTELLRCISDEYLNELWNSSKSKIDVCQICEFRYNCIDNRVPIKRKNDTYFYEKTCNYNPYIAKWQDEDGYKTLTECGVTSNAEGFKINRKKLNAINKELWGDD